MAWNDGLIEGSPAYNLASSNAPVIRAVAGPGSGKSFAIKRRIARLLEEGILGNQILAVTFTRTAAQDLKTEIASLDVPGANDVDAKTLHSHALGIIMQAGALEATNRVPRMVIEHEVTPSFSDLDERYGGLREKKNLLSAYKAAWAQMQQDNPGFARTDLQREFERDIVAWLVDHQGILVDEVIPIATEFLRNNPAHPEIGRYRIILVDEYQDLNRSEQELIRLLKGEASIVIVGDDDQSIYGFKFAHPSGIREVQNIYGEFNDVPFNECRRCPRTVTRMASRLISNNPNRTLGELVPHEHNQDGTVQIIQWRAYDEELTGLTRIIAAEIAANNVLPQDVLILSPRRKIGYRLRDNLLAAGVPVKSYFREQTITNASVRRAYSLFSHIAFPADKISLRFLLGFGSNDYRRAQYARLKTLAHENNVTIQEVLNRVLKGELPDTGLRTILEEYRKILVDVANFKKAIVESPDMAIQNTFVRNEEDEENFYELNQLYSDIVQEKGTEALADVGQVDGWITAVFKSLQEKISLPETPTDLDHVRIMSLHSSKGLSAKFVILTSMIDSLMPYLENDLADDERVHQIEEQRRLFYVAITRCKSSAGYPGRLIISSFLSMRGVEALRLGIAAPADRMLYVRSTRFLQNFGDTSPAPVRGETLVI